MLEKMLMQVKTAEDQMNEKLREARELADQLASKTDEELKQMNIDADKRCEMLKTQNLDLAKEQAFLQDEAFEKQLSAELAEMDQKVLSENQAVGGDEEVFIWRYCR